MKSSDPQVLRRRERNRIAAQKVRDGREERKNNLVVEVKELEDEQSKLKTEIKSLQCIKEDCEFLLGVHKPKCDKSIKRKKEEDLQDNDKRSRLSKYDTTETEEGKHTIVTAENPLPSTSGSSITDFSQESRNIGNSFIHCSPTATQQEEKGAKSKPLEVRCKQNREAEQRCRKRKRDAVINVDQEIRALECSNVELRYRGEILKKEINKLRKLWDNRMNEYHPTEGQQHGTLTSEEAISSTALSQPDGIGTKTEEPSTLFDNVTTFSQGLVAPIPDFSKFS